MEILKVLPNEQISEIRRNINFISYNAYLAGYEAAESDARERAIKALNIILGEISIDVMTNQFKLGCDYREKFLKHYNNETEDI